MIISILIFIITIISATAIYFSTTKNNNISTTVSPNPMLFKNSVDLDLSASNSTTTVPNTAVFDYTELPLEFNLTAHTNTSICMKTTDFAYGKINVKWISSVVSILN